MAKNIGGPGAKSGPSWAPKGRKNPAPIVTGSNMPYGKSNSGPSGMHQSAGYNTGLAKATPKKPGKIKVTGGGKGFGQSGIVPKSIPAPNRVPARNNSDKSTGGTSL